MMMPRVIRLGCCLGLSLPLALAGCTWGGPSVWVEDVRQLSVTAAGLSRLDVTTHNGALTVTGEPQRNELDVTIRIKAGGNSVEDAQDCLDAIEIISEAAESETHKLGWRWSRPRYRRWNANVSFEIRLPNHLIVSGTTHNGGITADGLAADVRLETHNGRVNLNASAGDVFVKSHNGRIEAATGGARVECITHNGGIDLVATDAQTVHLETHNGGVTAMLPDVQGIAGTITTHNGSLTVGLGESASALIDCETHSGRVRSEIPWAVSEMSRHRARGSIGEGGPMLALETHNGDIRLTRATH